MVAWVGGLHGWVAFAYLIRLIVLSGDDLFFFYYRIEATQMKIKTT